MAPKTFNHQTNINHLMNVNYFSIFFPNSLILIYIVKVEMTVHRYIPAKPLQNNDTVSVHFNHFYCMGICDKLSRHLSMLTYIYLNVDECLLTSPMP